MPRVQRISYDKLWNSWIDAMTTSMTWRQRKAARIKRLSSSKCYEQWFCCLFIYLLYKNTFHDWFQRISTKTLNPWNTTQIKSSTILVHAPREARFADTRLIQTPRSYGEFGDSFPCPWGKPLHFLEIQPGRPLMRPTMDSYFLPNQQILIESQPRQCGHFFDLCSAIDLSANWKFNQSR